MEISLIATAGTSDGRAEWLDKMMKNEVCFIGTTWTSVIQLILNQGPYNLMTALASAAWDGSTYKVVHNGVTLNMADFSSAFATRGVINSQPTAAVEEKMTALKAAVDVVVQAAIEKISTEVTNCMGTNAATFAKASVAVIDKAIAYFGEAGFSSQVDFLVSRSESLEEEAYAFEKEMESAQVPECMDEAYKCFFSNNRDAIRDQINDQIASDVNEMKTRDWHVHGDTTNYASLATGTAGAITWPDTCQVPKLKLFKEDHSTNSFENFLDSFSSSSKSFTGTSGLAAAWNASGTGADIWEGCDTCNQRTGSGIAMKVGDCLNPTVYDYFYGRYLDDWQKYLEAFSEAQALLVVLKTEENNQISQWTKDEGLVMSEIEDGYFMAEKFLTDAINIHIPEIVHDMEVAWSEYKTSNVWKGFREVNTTDVAFTASISGDYGCTGETLAGLKNHSTKFGIYGYDACSTTSTMKYRKPFITGVLFSEVLGAYDPFSAFLNSQFCSSIVTAYGQNGNMQDISAVSSELLTMLHGFGGDDTFLHISAESMNFLNRGVVRTGNPSHATADLVICNTLTQTSSTVQPCKMLIAPGGFLVVAPAVAACPLAMKTWYYNSEFAGFALDYVVFEVPYLMATQMSLDLQRFGIFGFSMGGWGTMGAVATYPYAASNAAAFNSPVYPGGCFFLANCHQECYVDHVLCELEYTTTGMAINSYVIIFADSLVISLGSMDPMGVGAAVHLDMTMATKTRDGTQYEIDVVQCGTYTYGGSQAETTQLTTYYSKSNVVAGSAAWVNGCSHQHWNDSLGSCGRWLAADNSQLATPNVAFDTSKSSIKITFDGFNAGTTVDYSCKTASGGDCTTSACCSNTLMANPALATTVPTNTASTAYNCPMYTCSTFAWCLEKNLAEGSASYLLPLHASVASAKFVPASAPASGAFANLGVTGDLVASAYAKFAMASPTVKFFYNTDMFKSYPTILYMHCSQNDEYELFTPHSLYAQLMIGLLLTTTSEKRHLLEGLDTDSDGGYTRSDNANSGSVFGVDFSDCDWHTFSESDLQKALLVFSDAFRTYSINMWSPTAFDTAYVAHFQWCFLATNGYTPTFATSGTDSNPCTALLANIPSTQSTLRANALVFNNVASKKYKRTCPAVTKDNVQKLVGVVYQEAITAVAWSNKDSVKADDADAGGVRMMSDQGYKYFPLPVRGGNSFDVNAMLSQKLGLTVNTVSVRESLTTIDNDGIETINRKPWLTQSLTATEKALVAIGQPLERTSRVVDPKYGSAVFNAASYNADAVGIQKGEEFNKDQETGLITELGDREPGAYLAAQVTTLSSAVVAAMGEKEYMIGCTVGNDVAEPRDMFSKQEWKIAHSFNEVECDITALMTILSEEHGLEVEDDMCPINEGHAAFYDSYDFRYSDAKDTDSGTVCSENDMISSDGTFGTTDAECLMAQTSALNMNPYDCDDGRAGTGGCEDPNKEAFWSTCSNLYDLECECGDWYYA
jgi:hypothetical protein